MSESALTAGRAAWMWPRGLNRITFGRIAFGVALLALWELAARTLGPYLISAPLDVAERLVHITLDGELLVNTEATLWLSLSGFVAASTIGIAIPVALAFVPRLAEAISPYVRGAMGLPPFAIAPLLVLWLGIGFWPKFVIVFAVVFFLMYAAADAGVRSINPRLAAIVRVLGANGRQLAWEVLMRSMFPFLLVGVKVALPRAIGAAIVGEFIVADRGLGFYIEHSREMADQVGMFAGVIAVTVLILVISTLLGRAERRLLSWRPKGPAGL
jgi:NitT/TauT family transport system permease protein